MEKLSQIYDIYIFTSASKNVAEQILNYIDPKKSYFLGVLSKEECLISEKGRVIKDLRIINNKDLKDLILIDHAPFFSITTQIDNEIPLLFWDGNSDDCELKYLTKYLKKIRDSIDVREENRKLLKLSELLRECSNKF